MIVCFLVCFFFCICFFFAFVLGKVLAVMDFLFGKKEEKEEMEELPVKNLLVIDPSTVLFLKNIIIILKFHSSMFHFFVQSI